MSGYHRDRDRERDRGMHMNDKRKYVATRDIYAASARSIDRFYEKSFFSDYYRYSSGPPSYGYGPGSYGGSSGGGYPPADLAPGHFRGRGYPGDSYSNDWRINKDYRRDYDRRPPPPNGSS